MSISEFGAVLLVNDPLARVTQIRASRGPARGLIVASGQMSRPPGSRHPGAASHAALPGAICDRDVGSRVTMLARPARCDSPISVRDSPG
ncbi:MAG: hypothetical protein J2P36_36365 [Ktedonobacteraceae bacterium]|nr:hypothetical protein [Ktedonobacteraceae bacterium]